MLLLLLWSSPSPDVPQWAYRRCNCSEAAPFLSQIEVAHSIFNCRGSNFVTPGHFQIKCYDKNWDNEPCVEVQIRSYLFPWRRSKLVQNLVDFELELIFKSLCAVSFVILTITNVIVTNTDQWQLSIMLPYAFSAADIRECCFKMLQYRTSYWDFSVTVLPRCLLQVLSVSFTMMEGVFVIFGLTGHWVSGCCRSAYWWFQEQYRIPVPAVEVQCRSAENHPSWLHISWWEWSLTISCGNMAIQLQIQSRVSVCCMPLNLY